ncbi:MAG: hypothetical protein HFJ41_08145, partial [Clostridia bacterium]|nr:hypothetical protein [Clostridia bacterium]
MGIRPLPICVKTDAGFKVQHEEWKKADVTQVPKKWMQVCDEVEFLKDIKLFVHNCSHAACAYAGYVKGYTTTQDAERDDEIAALMKGCLAEASAGIRAEFHPTLEQLEMVGCSMKAKEDEIELISRVAENPVRKLGRHDRLTGAAMYCLK